MGGGSQAAEDAGFESCWIADHLVLPVEMEGMLQGRCETLDDLRRWEDAGVHRLVVTPWYSTRGALDAVWRFAERFIS